MRSIVTAMAMDEISINDLSIAEDKIVESINAEDNKNPVIKYSADYADGVLSTCLRCKAEALIIAEKLTGVHDIVDIIKDVKNALPDITIVVLLLSQRDVGDILLSRLVMSGVYNWLPAPWRPSAIAEMVNHPRRLKDVEQYMPKLMEDGNGGFNAVIVKPIKASQISKNNKPQDKKNAFHSVQSINNDTPKDLNDIAPSVPQPNPLSKKNSKTYKSLFSTNGNKFTDTVNVVRCKEIGRNNDIEFTEAKTEIVDDTPLFSSETINKIFNNNNDNSKTSIIELKKKIFTSMFDEQKDGENVLVDARSNKAKETTVSEPIVTSTENPLEQHKAKQFQSNTFFASQTGKSLSKKDVEVAPKRDLNAALKAAESLVKERVKNDGKDIEGDNGSALNLKSAQKEVSIVKQPSQPKNNVAVVTETKTTSSSSEIKTEDNIEGSIDEKLRQRILSYIKRRTGKDNGDDIWGYFDLDPQIHNIVVLNLCSLRSSVPLFLMEAFDMMNKEPTLYDCSKDHTLFSSVNGVFTVKESRYLTVKNEINAKGVNIIYGTVGHSLKPLFDIADKLIIVCPSDTSMMDRFMKEYGTFNKPIDYIVVEPSIDDTALKNLVKQYYDNSPNTYVKGIKVGGAVEGTLEPSIYYRLLNEGFGFTTNMCYLFQMNPLLLNMCEKREDINHE